MNYYNSPFNCFNFRINFFSGITITTTFSDKNLSSTFRQLSGYCDSVICCRMSPLQKAEVVTLEDNDEDKLDFEADEPEN